MRASIQVMSNIHRFKKETIQHNLPAEPRQDQLEHFYNALVTSLESNEMPIQRLNTLQPRGTTLPSEPTIDAPTLDTCNRVLFNKLMESIPDECTSLRAVLDSYASEQDGYSALYSIMRTKCRYLQDLLPPWGPPWTTATTAYQYLAELKSFLAAGFRTSKNFSDFEVAAEILQQAQQHPEYNLIATTNLSRLTSYTTARDQLPSEFHKVNLINTLETNKNTTAIPVTPHVNRFGGDNGSYGSDQNRNNNGNRNGNRNSGGSFKYRNEVQCTACKTFGHSIGDNVCRICAQVSFVNSYIDKEPDNAKKNASAFEMANNKKRINKVRETFPEAFFDNMTDEEEQFTLCKLARAWQPDTESESD
jgi:hypothetical protein